MAVSPSAAADPSSQTSTNDSSSPSQPSQSANKSISDPPSEGQQHTIPNGTAAQHSTAQDTTSSEQQNGSGKATESSGPSSSSGQVPAASNSSSGATPAQRSVPGTPPRESMSDTQKDINKGAKTVDSSSKPSKPSTANGNGNHKSGPSGASRAQKKSVLEKLLRILIPCAYPDSATHPIDLRDGPLTTGASQEKQVTPTAEKPASKEKPNLTVVTAPKEPTPPPTGNGAAGDATTEAEQTVLVTPPPLEDAAVVVPPTPPPQLLPVDETEGVTSGAVQAPGSTGEVSPTAEQKRHSQDLTPSPRGDEESEEGSSFTEEDDLHDDDIDGLEEEERLIMNGGAGIPIGPDGVPRPLLPPIAPQHAGRKCLVLDLDETLVHSSFKSLQQADYVVPVEIEYQWHNVYVIKRPGVDTFLKKMGEIYEVVVFTASLSKYADPVLDKLDIHNVVTHRLFRESCYNHKGNYVKDLSQLGRPIQDTIILDNSPASYIFHPNNAVPVSSWFNDPHDTELTDLVPFLADLAHVEDVRAVLDGAR